MWPYGTQEEKKSKSQLLHEGCDLYIQAYIADLAACGVRQMALQDWSKRLR